MESDEPATAIGIGVAPLCAASHFRIGSLFEGHSSCLTDSSDHRLVADRWLQDELPQERILIVGNYRPCRHGLVVLEPRLHTPLTARDVHSLFNGVQ